VAVTTLANAAVHLVTFIAVDGRRSRPEVYEAVAGMFTAEWP
jgi:hypothetical protein